MVERMKKLVDLLNSQTDLYNQGKSIISDGEWDTLYFELVDLEKELGYALPNSPTQTIRYLAVDSLQTVVHDHPMLSLEKTKDKEEVYKFFGDKKYVIMAKMDGLTCSLTYEDGNLVRAETRGDGIEGEDITHNAFVVKNIPKKIRTKQKLVIDGEIICDIETFKEFSHEYKNPRNFAAGSIRLFSSKECEKRKLKFIAWDLIEGLEDDNSFYSRLMYLNDLGFSIVPVDGPGGEEAIMRLVEELHYPIDGLVYKFDDIAYGKSLGATDHHFRNALAFKFIDEEKETTLLNIEWSMGRTGVLTPIAIFEPIELEGTIVERASLHNVSIMKKLLGENPTVGQKVWVYKANQIIPQISRAAAPIEGAQSLEIPAHCPICGDITMVIPSEDTDFLYCENPYCEGKLVNRLDHFFGKKGLDIKGLSKATFEKLVEWDWVCKVSDVFLLSKYRDEWIKKPGFGEKSVDKLLSAIEQGRRTNLISFLSAIGIPLVGRAVAKDIVSVFPTYEEFRIAVLEGFDFSELDGFAGEKHKAITKFDYTEADNLFADYLKIEKEQVNKENITNNCKDLKFVITGSLKNFKNRDALKEEIEKRGGKVVSTVNKTTTALINNDVSSTSSKNRTAQSLGVPIISEEEFVNKYF